MKTTYIPSNSALIKHPAKSMLGNIYTTWQSCIKFYCNLFKTVQALSSIKSHIPWNMLCQMENNSAHCKSCLIQFWKGSCISYISCIISLSCIQKTVEVHSSKNFLTQINKVWSWYTCVKQGLVGQLVCVSLSLVRSKVLEQYLRDCNEPLYIRSTSRVDVHGVF